MPTGEKAGIHGPTVLYLAYYFPPLGGMGSLRSERFVRTLPRHGWRPLVVTARRGMYHGGLEGWSPPPGVEVVRTANPELSRLARGAWRRVDARAGGEDPGAAGDASSKTLRPLAPGRLGGTLRTLVRDLLYVPDAQVGWYPFARAAAARRVVAGEVDVVLTTSVPFTSHLVGCSLKRRFGVPWVAEFRDLWSGAQVPASTLPARRALDRRLERDLVKEADAVVVTTDHARRTLLDTWPTLREDRVHVVTNAWEPGHHPEPDPPPPDGPLVLVHAGTVIPGVQDPAPLLEAAVALEREAPGSVRVRALGPADPWREALERVAGPPGLLETPGILHPDAVRSELARASALVLLAPGEGFRPVILGKTFDWLGAGRPALMVAEPGGAMPRLLEASGGGVLVPRNEVGPLRAALEDLLRRQREGRLEALRPSREVADRYALDGVTGRLAGVLRTAVGRA